MRARFATVVLDVDSTLCGVEGVDWIARRRDPETAESCARLTERAMNGEIAVESAYGERLALIRPTAREIDELSAEYRRTLASDAPAVLSKFRAAAVRLILVSGGFRRAIEPVASQLGFARGDLFAVDLRWNRAGEYVGYDTRSPLAKSGGKLQVLQGLGDTLRSPRLAVGDGATDLEMREAVDAFAVFTGFVRRESVVSRADFVVASYEELAERVLTP